MNYAKLTAAVTALSFIIIGAADAASKQKRHKTVRHNPAGMYVPVSPYTGRTVGPIWAGPGECYTDEGYGRYWPCGAGKR